MQIIAYIYDGNGRTGILIKDGLNVARRTASDYLISLEEAGFLTSQKMGKEKVYLNKRLFDVVQKASLI